MSEDTLNKEKESLFILFLKKIKKILIFINYNFIDNSFWSTFLMNIRKNKTS